MKTLGAHGRHWHDWDCQRHVNRCHVYPMRRHLIAVFVVTRFVVDIVAVIVVVTLVPLVRFVIMVVISSWCANLRAWFRQAISRRAKPSSSSGNLRVERPVSPYPVEISENRSFSVSSNIELRQCFSIELKALSNAIV